MGKRKKKKRRKKRKLKSRKRKRKKDKKKEKKEKKGKKSKLVEDGNGESESDRESDEEIEEEPRRTLEGPKSSSNASQALTSTKAREKWLKHVISASDKPSPNISLSNQTLLSKYMEGSEDGIREVSKKRIRVQVYALGKKPESAKTFIITNELELDELLKIGKNKLKIKKVNTAWVHVFHEKDKQKDKNITTEMMKKLQEIHHTLHLVDDSLICLGYTETND